MRFKNFVEKTKVAQDRDVDELPGTQPSKYYSGVDKDDKEKRAKQFARQAKMSDDDPKAYKPAPGDKGTETKPSKYTKKFKQMYGEGENVAVARERIKREKEADKAKHDAMLDRARTADTRTKNRQESVSESAPRWIKDLVGGKMHPKQYKKAEELLKDLIARKKKEAGNKGLKHSIEYYAAQIARNFANVDARNLARMVNEEVSQKQIDDLERFADRLLAKFKVDVEFTKHFKDRMNDKRNSPEIKVVELQKLFKKIQKNKAKNIQGNAGLEAVLKDLSSDLNLPVVIKQRGDEIELVNKTIMRKSDFKTTSKIIKYEEFTSMDEASRADMKVRKRPHMMLKAGNAGVKFDGRFKMFKKKQMLQDDEKPLEESFESLEEQIFGLMESTESLFEDPNKSLQNKSDKSGIKKSILKKVYDRGVAAWRTGHRPGTTPEQWGLARVNSFITGGKTRTTADADLWKQRNEEMNEGKSSTGYELYHKDFSTAMQHAYKHAKDKLKIDIDPEEIDNKVATGPRKPSKGKTNSYRLLDKDGKKSVQIQVYNMDNKRYELNMYKEDIDVEFESLVEEDLQENAKIKKAIDNAHKFFVKTSKGKSERIQDKNRFAAMEMLKNELEKAGVGERDMMKAFGELDNHIIKVMGESVELEEAKYTNKQYKMAFGVLNDPRWKGGNMTQIVNTIEKIAKGLSKDKTVATALRLTNEGLELEEKVNVKGIQKAVDDGKSMDVIMTMFANKRTTNTDEIRKVVKDYMWKKRMKKEEVELEEGINDPGIFKAVFLAGGPGSGKSFMVGKTALTTLGLKLINSDPAFEAQLKKVGLKATPEDIFTDKGQEARDKAKRLTAKQQELALKGRLGLVIDGTGKDYAKIEKQAIDLKKLGYEVGMIFVNTNLETAIARDAKRDRTLGAKEVTNMWNAVQDNIGKFQKFFGTGMIIVDNSDGADWKTGSTTAYKKMSAWVKKPVKSPMAKKWIDSQKQQRGITEEDSKKLEESKKPLEYGTQETTDTFKKATPGEGAPSRFSQRIRESILRSRRKR